MKAVIVYPNADTLSEIEKIIAAVHPDYQLETFTDSMLAYQHIFQHREKIDVLYTMVEMKRIDGFSLARMIRRDNRAISVNMISRNECYRDDVRRFGCDSFILYPFTLESLVEAESDMDW